MLLLKTFEEVSARSFWIRTTTTTMSSPPAPYFDVNYVDNDEAQQLDFTDNPFVAPEEQYRFDLKQWLSFIHEVRAKLSYLQVYALEEGPQIPQLKRVVQDLGDVVEFIDESVGQLTPDDNQKKALYSSSPNSTNKRPFSAPNLRDNAEHQPAPESYATPAITTNTPAAQYTTEEYYAQHSDAAERQATWSQTVRPNARHSTRGWMFELGSSRRAINPEQYRTTTLSSRNEFSGPASSPNLAVPKRRLENSYQSIPLGSNTNYTATPTTTSTPYHGATATPVVQPYGPTTTQPYGPTTTQPYGPTTTQPYGPTTTQPYGASMTPVNTTVAPYTAQQPLGVVTAPVPRTPDMFGPMPPRSATDSAPKMALSPGMAKRRADPGTNYQLIPTSNSAQLRNSSPGLTATSNVTPVTPNVVSYQSTPLPSNQVTPVNPSVVSYQSTPFNTTPNVTPVNSNPAPTLAANPKRAPVVYSTSK